MSDIPVERMLAYDVQMAELIKEHGWACQGVFATVEEPAPSFVYTVGLSCIRQGYAAWVDAPPGAGFFDHPELFIVGLDPHVGTSFLNDLGTRVKDGATLAAGDVFDDIANLPLRLISIDSQMAEMNFANAYFATPARAVDALQVCWPDTQGRFPWENGYDIDPRIQPLYGTP